MLISSSLTGYFSHRCTEGGGVFKHPPLDQKFCCLLACQRGWWCTRIYPNAVSGKLTIKFWERCRSPPPPPPPPPVPTFFKAGAASWPACNVKTPPPPLKKSWVCLWFQLYWCNIHSPNQYIIGFHVISTILHTCIFHKHVWVYRKCTSIFKHDCSLKTTFSWTLAILIVQIKHILGNLNTSYFANDGWKIKLTCWACMSFIHHHRFQSTFFQNGIFFPWLG